MNRFLINQVFFLIFVLLSLFFMTVVIFKLYHKPTFLVIESLKSIKNHFNSTNYSSDEKINQMLEIFEMVKPGSSNEMINLYRKWKLPPFDYENLQSYKDLPPVIFPIIPGAAQNGKRFNITLTDEEKELKDKTYKIEFFNIFASDRTSFERKIEDVRPAMCQNLTYDEDLPKASIILTFQNEALSLLLRTIHTVIKFAPSSLIQEIILIDDNSDREEIKGNLSKYIYDHFPDKVKIFRLKERGGLMRARVVGASVATGDVLVYLDSHCEANVNWLVPLLAQIKTNNRTIACPIVDIIDGDSMLFFAAGSYIGGFSWHLHYLYRSFSERVKRTLTGEHDVIKTPTMSGGLFAIGRQWFWEIGGFDPGMEVWGAENIEISFKTWMCGGSLVLVPCSRLGHMSRWKHIYSEPDYDYFGINSARVAEVWMDSYKEYFYLYKPKIKDTNIGDVSDRIELRKQLKCKSFQWYLDNIYPEKFLFTQNVKAWGRVKNENYCLDVFQHFMLELYAIEMRLCSIENGQQIFSYSSNHEIRREELCFQLDSDDKDKFVYVSICNDDLNQQWNHIKDGPIMHKVKGLCLDRENVADGGKVFVTFCIPNKPSQQWIFQYYTNM